MHDGRDVLAEWEAGSEPAAAEIVARYGRRLLALVRERLSPALDRRFDEEDVVQSTFRSFFVRARDGRFACDELGDLWRLLAAIAVNKLRRSVATHVAEKRSVRGTRSLADVSGFGPVGREPSVSTLAVLADELNALAVDDDERRVLEARMSGATNAEIAAELGCAERTVRRIVERIRDRATSRIAVAEGVERADGSESGATSSIDERDLVLHEMIGAGGVGKVYRATRWSTGETVAVKFLRKRVADSPFVLERFREEARVLGELRHPGIVRILGTGRSRGALPFLVTEWHAGGDLESRLGRCTVGEAIGWTRAIAEAVGVAHSHGIVHCDLKPANVLMGERGPVVVDFGHAIRPATNARSVGGTRAYLAPELRDDPNTPVDTRCDVYGVGAILHALVSGSPPTVVDLDPMFTSITGVLDRSLAHRPADRFGAMADLVAALDAVRLPG